MIGRIEEQKKLLNAMESDESAFIAVYGRRRVGKTYLIRETFGGKFTFAHTGLAKKTTREQLQNFQISLRNYGLKTTSVPENWLDAFEMLATLIKESKQP
ncbi:MAG: ATP-binding protein, partial [Bacteroidales bacterium]|nr:ATP-binding protein [Bacteroidales bacterium]